VLGASAAVCSVGQLGKGHAMGQEMGALDLDNGSWTVPAGHMGAPRHCGECGFARISLGSSAARILGPATLDFHVAVSLEASGSGFLTWKFQRK
jgi:hypothetical protein